MNISSSMSISSALRISPAIVALLGAACSSRPAPPRSSVYPTGPRPVFFGRALATADQRRQTARDPDFGLTVFDGKLEQIYAGIDPERSLFIHDVAACCAKDDWYSLASRLRQAGTIVDAVHPDDVVAQWRQSYQQRFQPQSPPAENTLQLWAVVNRLDLETPELHIVYGPPDPSINFRMILEFVLSTDGLPTLAGQWKHLSDFDLHSTQFSGLSNPS